MRFFLNPETCQDPFGRGNLRPTDAGIDAWDSLLDVTILLKRYFQRGLLGHSNQYQFFVPKLGQTPGSLKRSPTSKKTDEHVLRSDAWRSDIVEVLFYPLFWEFNLPKIRMNHSAEGFFGH